MFLPRLRILPFPFLYHLRVVRSNTHPKVAGMGLQAPMIPVVGAPPLLEVTVVLERGSEVLGADGI